tara:strand:- start:2616 stop:4121 length:1506 start_codon:yes stop_codon:yes gene_type:complete
LTGPDGNPENCNPGGFGGEPNRWYVEGQVTVFQRTDAGWTISADYDTFDLGPPYCQNYFLRYTDQLSDKQSCSASIKFVAIMEQVDGGFGVPTRLRVTQDSVFGKPYQHVVRHSGYMRSSRTRTFQSESDPQNSPCATCNTQRINTDIQNEFASFLAGDREQPELVESNLGYQFVLTAEIIDSECLNGLTSELHGECTADLPPGCYEHWNFKATHRHFDGETQHHFDQDRNEWINDPFTGCAPRQTRLGNFDCNVQLEDESVVSNLDIDVSYISPISKTEPVCFVDYYRLPALKWNRRHGRLGNLNTHCADPSTPNDCYTGTENGCYNRGDQLGYAIGSMNDGNATEVRTFVGGASAPSGMNAVALGCGQPEWPVYFVQGGGSGQTFSEWLGSGFGIVDLPGCPIHYGDGRHTSIRANVSDSVDQLGLGQTRDEACLDTGGSGCPEPSGIVSGLRPAKSQYATGQETLQFEITCWQRVYDLPDYDNGNWRFEIECERSDDG